jgi:branched-chain amino acid transport system substrate-binding protein
VKVQKGLAVVLTILMICLIAIAEVSAQSKEPISIGAVQPLTGWAALDGKNVTSGMKIALERINASGGVLGRPLNLIIEDGKADPVESVTAVEKLIRRDKVPAIIGCWGSSATLAAMPVVERNKIPMVVETSTAPMITEKKNKWIFRFTSNNDTDGVLMGEYLVPKLGFKKVAYLAVNNDWGRSMAKATSEIMKNTGGEVIMVEYCAASEANFTPVLTRIKNSPADTMFITTSLSGIVLIMKQYHELGMKMNVFITSGMSAEQLVQMASKEVFEGVYFFARYIPTAPPRGKEKENQEMIAAFEKMHPNIIAECGVAAGYDSLYIVAGAIERAGAPDSIKIRDALEKTDYNGFLGKVRFDKNGHSQPRCHITQVRNGMNKVIYVLKE